MSISKIFVAAVSLSLSMAALADQDAVKASNNQIGLQYVSTHVNYTETGNGIYGTHTGTLDTENGNVPGFAVAASIMKDLWLGNDYVQVQYGQNSGHTDYVGSYQGGTFGSLVSTSGAKMTDFNVRYGKGFGVGETAVITPYLEVGYHKWERGVNEGETYSHNWYGLGVMDQFSPDKNWVISVSGFIGKTASAKINVAGSSGFDGALGTATMSRVGLGADYALSKSVHANAGLDYTAFKYGMSGIYDIGGGYVSWEPDSKTRYTTYHVGLGYAF